MAEGGSLPLEDLVTCAICQEVYQDPIAMHCLHTLCKICVETLKRRSPMPNCIQCPICRELSDTRFLKHDFRIQNLVDLHNHQQSNQLVVGEISEKNACQLCSKKSFSYKCVQCDKYLCESCEETHRGIPSCAHHTVTSLRDLLTSCGVTLTRVTDVMLRDRDTLIDKLDSLEEYASDLEQLHSDMVDSLVTSEDDVINKVRAHFLGLRQELDNRVNNHKAKAEAAKGQTLQVMDKVMQRSLKVMEALSGVDAVTLLTNIDDLESEKNSLTSDDYLLLPKWQMEVVQGKQWHTDNFNSIVKIEAKSEPKLLCGSKSQKQKTEKTFTEVLHHTRSLTADESSATLYKFQYCDQVTHMLVEIQRNLAAHAREHKLQGGGRELNAMDLIHIGKTSCSVSPSVNATPQCASAQQIMNGALEQELATHRDSLLSKSDDPQCLRIVGDEIWCVYQDWINVYEFDLSFKSCFQRVSFSERGEEGRFLNMKAMTRAHTGHYFQACESSGLRVLKPTRVFIRVLHTGNICDVIAENEHVYALDVKANEIVVFDHRPSNARPQYRQSPWMLDQSISCQFTLTSDDTLGCMGGVFFVCSFRNDTVYRYSVATGAPLSSIQSSPSRRGPGHLWRPRICCSIDGALVIADHYHNRLQVLRVQGSEESVECEWRVLRFEPQLNFPWDAVVGRECGLVVLERCNWKHKLRQFIPCTE